MTAAHLLSARWIVPVEPAGITLEHHSLLVEDGVITALLPTAEAHRRHPDVTETRLDSHALIPGLVNLHTHAAMSLMRGLKDDLPLMTWLKEHIWPAENRHVSAEFVQDGSLLACAEMLRAGVTCFNDMYFFPEATADAVLASGMRAALGIITLDFPSSYAGDPEDYLRKGLAVRDAYKGESRLSFTMAPHAPYTVSDRTLTKILTLADQLELPIHMHLHETADEIAGSLAEHQVRPLTRLQALGLLGPTLIAVHMVHLNEAEIELIARAGVHVAHCPSSNLKLASGIAPVPALLAAGVNVALGTDGAASNNRLDLLNEARTAALLAKGSTGEPTALTAHQALAMATLHGARALGLDARIGSLVPGKAADIVAVDLSELETLPCYDVVSHLVYAAGREHISHVWVEGELLLDARVLTKLDERELMAKASHWNRILGAKT
ncbi:TRZ/ATZ family hydrolase [Thiobacter aerophilum]|uniref:5-methylthioadenosine/S-adenosylhomocysteine deaminase n=1 Tax=Thiobacter aerophilum TaxID=3121275 RepID=A0ABV0EBW2_9BURK